MTTGTAYSHSNKLKQVQELSDKSILTIFNAKCTHKSSIVNFFLKRMWWQGLIGTLNSKAPDYNLSKHTWEYQKRLFEARIEKLTKNCFFQFWKNWSKIGSQKNWQKLKKTIFFPTKLLTSQARLHSGQCFARIHFLGSLTFNGVFLELYSLGVI